MTSPPNRPRIPSLLAAPPSESLRRQESGLILLNLGILAGIALAHALFTPAAGGSLHLFFAVLSGRMLLQAGELIWLQRVRDPGRLGLYSHLSIATNLGFAFVLSRLGGFEDSHYVVLMLVPLVAAAFRYRPAGIALVLAAAAALTFLDVWFSFHGQEPARMAEYFAAASFVLIYIVVALVVAVLARQVRLDQEELERHLDALARTRDRLVREEKLAAVGRLASGIAHEIRNPVAMILSAVSMGRSGGGLPREELDEIVAQEAGRLDRLTSDFLLYARQKPPERRPVCLAEVLGYVAGVVQPRLAEAGVSLSVDAPDGLFATVDPFQIQQALLNLLLNAVDATPAGGALVLGVAADGADSAVLFVEDSGPAVPAEVAARIFEPFFTTRPAGSGLGLPITRSIAQAHGGDVTLAVNEPGRVRFCLTLPGAVCPPPAGAPEATRVGAHPDR